MARPATPSLRLTTVAAPVLALASLAGVLFWSSHSDTDDLTHALLAVTAATSTAALVHHMRISHSDRRANEDRLAVQGQALMELTAQQMQRAANIEERLGLILETCARTLEAGRVSIWRFDADGAAIRCLNLFDLESGAHSSGETIRKDSYPAYFEALEQERFIAADDAHRDPRTREFAGSYLTPHGIGSMLDVPLRRKDEVSGVMCVEHVGGARAWTVDERTFVLAVANLIVASVATDERREALRRLADSEARSRLIVDTAPDAFIGIDGTGQIVAWNAQAAATFGWSAEEAVGLTLAETIIPPSLRAAHVQGLRRFFETGHAALGNRRLEATGLHRDGHEFPIEIAVTHPISTREGVFVGAFLRDISERHSREAELRRAKEAAEDATRAKSEFLANMSHELRTPLNGVLGYAQLLQRDRTLSPGHKEALDSIARCGTHLLDLINDVLDLSKIEAGRVEIDAAPCDVRQAAVDVRQIIAEPARRKGLKLEVDVAPEVPSQVVLDGPHLRQVLLNLLGNAVKFTAAGTVCLRIARRGPSLRFEVADTGVGIEPESLDLIFQAFRQTSTGAAEGGTGLGLTISQRLVRSMGGKLDVLSTPGRGSTFFFDLPIEEVSDRPAETADAAPGLDQHEMWPGIRLAPGQQVTALVVDDSSVNRRLLAALLESASVRVISASSGQEALELAAKHHPDLVLLDLRMPGMDGIEVARRLRTHGSTPQPPVIAVTASAQGDVRAAALEAGCAEVLTKPIRAAQLFSMLSEHAGVSFTHQADAPQPECDGTGDWVGSASAARLREAAATGNVAAVEAIVRDLSNAAAGDDPLVSKIASLADNLDYDSLVELADHLDRRNGGACAVHR